MSSTTPSTTYSEASGTPVVYPQVPVTVDQATAGTFGVEQVVPEEQNWFTNAEQTAQNVASEVGSTVQETVSNVSTALGFS